MRIPAERIPPVRLCSASNMKTIEGKVVMLGSQGKRSSVNEAMKLPDNYRYVTKGHSTLRSSKSQTARTRDVIAYLRDRVTRPDASFVVSRERLGERYPRIQIYA